MQCGVISPHAATSQPHAIPYLEIRSIVKNDIIHARFTPPVQVGVVGEPSDNRGLCVALLGLTHRQFVGSHSRAVYQDWDMVRQ
jgi:hypothetical protein